MRSVVSYAVAAAAVLLFSSAAVAAPRPVASHPVFVMPASITTLPGFHHRFLIGSAVDPTNGDQNPYGIGVAPIASGALAAGDIVVCNFNDAANVQGTGTTVIALHPVPGSSPRHLSGASSLLGCGALAIDHRDFIAVAANLANDDPFVSPTGAIVRTFKEFPWRAPWGEVFDGHSSLYVSNSDIGSIVRLTAGFSGFGFTTIATGFSVNNGVPGTVLAPSGLSYDARRDILYIVDGNVNQIDAISHVSRIPAGGVRVCGTGFCGPDASFARILFQGTPLNAPLGATVLTNGNLIVGDTGDNLIFEITPNGELIGMYNADHGASGALFDFTTTIIDGHDVVYFNEDNLNAVVALTP
jgi:hypothetical protein